MSIVRLKAKQVWNAHPSWNQTHEELFTTMTRYNYTTWDKYFCLFPFPPLNY